MRQPKYTYGQIIPLNWEGKPDALFIKGHMEPHDAKALFDYGSGDDFRFRTPVKAWARWSCEPNPDGFGQVLRDYDEPGPGRFPVMRVEVTHWTVDPYSWRERRERLGAKCDCTDWWRGRCVCDGGCCCHWSPTGGAWFHRAAPSMENDDVG